MKEIVLEAGTKVWRFERTYGAIETEKHFYTDAYGADAGALSVGFANAMGYKLVTYEVTQRTTVLETTIRSTKTKQYFSTELQKNIKTVSEE
ncbi:hypothetical protein [Paraflavitalea speifideaquila]|uniref:hypothetical protein n=1 Tax=Paraflavitalea speifideaquila TaxID=3076558 RepID=UPI0028E71A22|nr:hypothetical protein [Paraflavitalea speifideiaquila]